MATSDSSNSKKRSISMGNDNLVDSTGLDDADEASSFLYRKLSKADLVMALQERDARIAAALGKESKRAKRTATDANTTTTTVTTPVHELSPSSSSSSSSVELSPSSSTSSLSSSVAIKTTTTTTAPPPVVAATTTIMILPDDKVQEAKVEQVRRLAFQGIKSQIKWRPSCKNGTARFVYTGSCDEITFRSLVGLQEKDKKTKGGKFPSRRFQDDILRNHFLVRIPNGYLSLNGDVKVTYSNKGTGEIKITGAYGV